MKPKPPFCKLPISIVLVCWGYCPIPMPNLPLEFFEAFVFLFGQISLYRWHMLLLVFCRYFNIFNSIFECWIRIARMSSLLEKSPEEVLPMWWSFLWLVLLAFALPSTLLVYNCIVPSGYKEDLRPITWSTFTSFY